MRGVFREACRIRDLMQPLCGGVLEARYDVRLGIQSEGYEGMAALFHDELVLFAGVSGVH